MASDNVGFRFCREEDDVWTLGVIAFHEKAGRSQVVSLSFLFVTRFFSAELLTVATLPSALFDERVFSLGASWCSRFSRCCHLIVDLPSHPRWKLGQAINAVTGTRRLGFVLPIGSTTRLPVAWPDCYCAAVHKPTPLPTGHAATPPTFERWARQP